MKRLRFIGILLALSVACQKRPPAPEAQETELMVFAAASLREAFDALAKEFERDHPATRVTLNFAGSQELRTQLEQGARADVFASADERHMHSLAEAKLVEAPFVFAHNEPVLVVSEAARALVPDFAALPNAARIVLGAPQVPIGRYATQIMARASESLGADFGARVSARVVSYELNVRQVLAKVALGEAQAGIVYRSDVGNTREKLAIVTIPRELNVMATYPIAAVTKREHPHLTRAWLELVRSERGQRALSVAGFLVEPTLARSP